MFLKVMWNRQEFPEFTLVNCEEVIVDRKFNDDTGEPYVHIVTGEGYSVCLKKDLSFAYVLNENGKTIETIRA